MINLKKQKKERKSLFPGDIFHLPSRPASMYVLPVLLLAEVVYKSFGYRVIECCKFYWNPAPTFETRWIKRVSH